VETLDLKTDGTYTYSIEFADGGRAIDAGRWNVVATSDRLRGAEVVLVNALDACSWSGEKVLAPARTDRRLETIWEWGRMVLSFNPDTQGFGRT